MKNNGLRIAVQEAAANLPTLVDEALDGREVLLTRGGEPVVRLVPVIPNARLGGILGSAKGTLLHMSDDFDAPLDDFDAIFDAYGLQRIW
jgi:prevent-host-death family protein